MYSERYNDYMVPSSVANIESSYDASKTSPVNWNDYRSSFRVMVVKSPHENDPDNWADYDSWQEGKSINGCPAVNGTEPSARRNSYGLNYSVAPNQGGLRDGNGFRMSKNRHQLFILPMSEKA